MPDIAPDLAPDLSGRHIVDTAWVAAHSDASGVVVLDCSWHLPQEKRDAKAEYRAGHIPGARFFDIDAISDHASPLPHMLAAPERFAAAMAELGIGDGDCVVVYDASHPGIMSCARVWWNLRAMGHDNVAVLDGGLKKWKAEGRPLSAEVPGPRNAGPFTARFRPQMVRDLAQMKALVENRAEQVVDARGAGRFAGRDPEPRPGLKSGHMPGARSVPFNTLLNLDGTMKSAAELRRAFEAAGLDLAKPVVTSCGSGVTAAVLSLGLALIGRGDTGLYDGSWSEWGQESLGLPIATGD